MIAFNPEHLGCCETRENPHDICVKRL